VNESDTYEHMALIPENLEIADSRLESVLAVSDLKSLSKDAFLLGWWALCYGYPGLHPDEADPDPDSGWESEWVSLADEAFRRADCGQLVDDELYPAEASHARLAREYAAIGVVV